MEDSLRKAMQAVRKAKKTIRPYLPLATRVLLTATFFEDALRAAVEWNAQVGFLRHSYGLPAFIAGFLLIVSTTVSVSGAVLIVARKQEKIASYLLMGFVLYQQALYGRHSPISSGNLGFLMRNLCLAGSLLLLSAQARMRDGKSALPGLLDTGDQSTVIEYCRLAGRVLIVLLSLEFLTTLGPLGTILTLPVILAVLVGYQSGVSGALLLGFYFVHNLINSPFWFMDSSTPYGSFEKEVKRFEFVQTLSIMGGLLLLVSSGSGSISVDDRINKRKNF